jgi:hypothetical protein
MKINKRIFCLAAFAAAAWTLYAQNAVEVSFVFTRQSGAASNQYAVWVEDAAGAVVKTLYATQYTARGGWKVRAQSIPLWVKKSGVASMSKASLDAITAATPRAGTVVYTWDGTDTSGKKAPRGEYRVVIEGSLRWGGRVVYTAVVSENAAGQIAVETRYYDGETELTDSGIPLEKNMISSVSVSVQ